MNMLGEIKEDLPFISCSQFKPTLLDGQLCSSLNLASVDTERKETGKRGGLVIILDIGVKNTDQTLKGDSISKN